MFTRCLVAQFHESPAPTSFIPLPCILSIFIIPLPLLLTLLDLLIFLLPYYASFSSSSSVNSHVYTKTQTQIIETQANTHTCMSQTDTQSHMYGNTDRQTDKQTLQSDTQTASPWVRSNIVATATTALGYYVHFNLRKRRHERIHSDIRR